MQLSKEEWATIVAALSVVSPTGGGSAPFTLMRKIAQAQDIDWSSDDHIVKVRIMGDTVIEEYHNSF